MKPLSTSLHPALLFAGLLMFAQAFINPAYGHGSTEPQHGGVVMIVGEMSFELVTSTDKVELYLLDDGEELDTSTLSAKLKIKNVENHDLQLPGTAQAPSP